MAAIEYGATAPELCALYCEYDWWSDRDEADVRRALQNTDETVLLRDDDSGEAVAAARVMTDYVYYAMVYDVIVAADRCGEGLGQALVAAVRDHPRLQDVNPALLAREGLVSFYEDCGFEVMDDEVEHPDGDPEPLSWLVYSRE
jgi:predicted GNAT family N-acyltransferase